MTSKLGLTPAAGALLFALTAAPLQVREPLLEQIKRVVSDQNIPRLVTAVRWLFALGLASHASSWLTELANNNFRLRSERHRYDWPNEVAVVTGAAGGFGSLMSKDLASKGVNVMALDVRDALPDDMKNHPKIHYFKCDITNRAAVIDVATQIRQRFGDPSILINNAGIADDRAILDIPEDMVNAVYNINVISHYHTVQAFLPAMVAQKKGHIVTLASMASFVSMPRMGVYCSSKAAIMAFHEALQAETRALYNAPEIKFTLVHPTFAATAMTLDHREELKSRKMLLLDPQVVSDAIVKQVMSARGRQIVLNGNMGFLGSIRGWPSYVSQLLFVLVERGIKRVETTKQAGKQ